MADNDWADGSELAGLSRGGNVLERMGYDPDEVRANPALRAEVMQRVASPYQQTGVGGQPSTGSADRSAAIVAQMQNAVRMAPPVQGAGTAAQPPAAAAPRPAGPSQGSSQVTPATRPSAGGSSPAQMAGGGLDEIGAEALSRGMKLGGFAEQTARDMAASPGPDTDALEAQRAKDAVATPYRDPNTGKVLESAEKAGYKPGIGTEILRGVRGAVVGALTGGIPGGIVGAIEPQDIRGGTPYGAPDRAYQATEASREGRLASEDQQLENAKSNFKAMTDARSRAAAEARQGVTSYNDVARGAGELEKAGAGNFELHDTDQGPMMINKQTGEAQPVTANGQPVGAKVQLKESQPIMGPDNKPHTYMLDQQGNKVVDLGVHYERPAVQVNAGVGGALPGNAGVKGDDYLKTLPPDLANTVRAIGEYREAPPQAGNRSRQAQQLLAAVNQAYPEYRGDVWPTLIKARAAFTSSGIGSSINSFNTALNHLDRLEGNIPQENTGFSTYNAVANALSSSGSKRSIDLGKWDTDANAVSNEVQKAYKGGTVNKEEYETMQKLLDRNAAPEKMRSNIQELRELLSGKLDSFRHQYESGLPPGSVIPLNTIGEGGGAAGAQAAPATGGQSGQGDSWAARNGFARVQQGRQ
jgi:hypothetical protein